MLGNRAPARHRHPKPKAVPTKVGTHPDKNAPAGAGACPWRGTWAQYWALRVRPEKVLYALTRTYQVPAAGLLMVQVSLLPLRYGRQV